MWIVAIGWAYVVILMAATETSVIAGIMTFFGYGVLPLSILFYIAGAGRRRRRRADASVRPLEAPATQASLQLVTIAPLVPGSGTGAAPADCGGADSGCGGAS